jgi:hypothetical protein
MIEKKPSLIKALLIAAAAAIVVACGSSGDKKGRDVGLLGGKGERAVTVNRFLWAASLETLDFLPIQAADPISGLILTDWYENPAAPNERFKVNVYILDSALRADALRVSVFRQERKAAGAPWTDAAVSDSTPREIENAILTRARQLRLNVVD